MELQSARRDTLLMLLAVAAGSADAWSYFGLNHSFVANMTGNTVLVGVGLAHNGDWHHPLMAVCGYAMGVVAGALLTRKASPAGTWPRPVSWALLIEALLLWIAEAVWSMVGTAAPSTVERNLLLILVAIAVGIQSGAMLQMEIPGVVTTYITGTWTNLMSSVARLLSDHAKPATRDLQRLEERSVLQAGVLAAYFFSAILAGVLLRYAPGAAGALPAGSVLIVAVYGLR